MAILDLEKLSAPLSDDAPCGENLEYDPQYVALEQANQVKPEQQYGDTVIPAEDPDWQEVQRLALELLDRTRDLGVAVALAQSTAALKGLRGFADAMQLIRVYHEQFWDHFHPQLDPDDDNDPTMRANLLANLAQPDPTLRIVRTAPLIVSRVGRLSWKDVQVARGDLPHSGEGDPPSLALIEGAFAAQETADVEQLLRTLADAREALTGIESAMTERCGAAAVPNLSRLRDLLGDMHGFVQEQCARLGGGVADAGEGPAGEPGPAGGDAPAAGGAAPARPAFSGEIQSRADVLKALDQVVRYYQQAEPGSPIPLLIRRVRYLVDKDFLQIIEDLAPESLEALRALGGAAAQAGSAGGEEGTDSSSW